MYSLNQIVGDEVLRLHTRSYQNVSAVHQIYSIPDLHLYSSPIS